MKRTGGESTKRKEVKRMQSDPILLGIFVLMLVLLPLVLVGFGLLLRNKSKLNEVLRELHHANTNITGAQILLKNLDYSLTKERK